MRHFFRICAHRVYINKLWFHLFIQGTYLIVLSLYIPDISRMNHVVFFFVWNRIYWSILSVQEYLNINYCFVKWSRKGYNFNWPRLKAVWIQNWRFFGESRGLVLGSLLILMKMNDLPEASLNTLFFANDIQDLSYPRTIESLLSELRIFVHLLVCVKTMF